MKKILNIFASISLISAGVVSVVGCGSITKTNTDDQKFVSDITNRLNNKMFPVDENPNGYQTFGHYRSIVLKNIRAILKSQETNLVSLPSSDDNVKLGTKDEALKSIDVHIQSHNIKNDVKILVTLNNDAQSIADKLDTKTITVYNPQPGSSADFTTLAPINSYQSQIETQIRQLLISEGVKNSYGINFSWTNPKTHLIDNLSWVNDAIIGLKVNVGTKDTSKLINIRVKLAFSPSYAQQKGEIDDPNIGDRDFPEQIYTGGKSITSTKEWNEDGIDTALNSAWSFGDFEQYVSYEPTPLIFGQLTLVKLYCPLLGWTKDNPRYFYVKPY